MNSRLLLCVIYGKSGPNSRYLKIKSRRSTYLAPTFYIDMPFFILTLNIVAH